MKTTSAKTWIEISASALEHNVRGIQALVAPAQTMAIVKANAYGHGLVETAKILARVGVPWFGVDRLEEAETLREQGIKEPILILGYVPIARIKDAVRQGFSFVVYNAASINEAARVATGTHPAKVHLKIETGLMRQGVACEDLPSIVRLLKRSEHVWVEGISTHYANIEDRKDPAFAMEQLAAYQEAIRIVQAHGIDPAWKHTACSAAAILFPDTRFNMIRLGIAMYGLWSSEKTKQSAQDRKLSVRLQPVLTWKTMVAQIKNVSKGTCIGYGLTECVSRHSVIAVLPIGYADGFDRAAMSNKGTVLIRGKRCKIIGRVCMNMCMVDATDVKGIAQEDEVVLIGKQGKEEITAEECAKKAETINYEIVARLSEAIERRVV